MPNPRRSRSLLSVLALFVSAALFAAACGGSDSSDDGASDADTSTDDSAADASDDSAGSDDGADEDGADEAGADDGAASSTTSSTTTTTTTTTAAPSDIDPANATYCATVAEADAFLDTLPNVLDPVETEAWARQNVAYADEMVANAPDEIAADLQTLRASFDEFIAVLEASGWNLIAAAVELEALAEIPTSVAAEDRVSAWEAENCGGGGDADDAGDESALADAFASPEALEAVLSTEAGRELMIQGMTEDGRLNADQAACLLDNLDFEILSALAQGGDPTPEMLGQFFELLDTCDLASLLAG